ncbi:MAG: peptidylprolyl isomerase [Ignavibacteriaceae bacterium]
MSFKRYSIHIVFICLTFAVTYSLQAQVNKDLYTEISFDKQKTAASVDSIKITAEEFYLSYEYGPAFVKRKKDSRLNHIDYMINEKLLALDGYSRSIDTVEEISSLISDYKGDLASEELFKNEILPEIKVSDPEIDTIISYKQTELEIKWLFEKDKEKIKILFDALNNGILFDSLFTQQLGDSVFFDERFLKTNRYLLWLKNPILAEIVDSLKIGEASVPIHVEDGWYIVKVINIWQNVVTTESEYQKLRQEAVNAVYKKKMDMLSDQYVNELMLKNNPVIKREAFNIVRSYLGKLYLREDKYEDWQLEQKLSQSLSESQGDINNSVLISLTGKNITIKDFLVWFRNRSQYIKFNNSDLKSFSISLEKTIWRMVRDNLLAETATARGYGKSEDVIKQLTWWKDKIISSAVRNEVANSVLLKMNEVSGNESIKTDAELLNREFQKKFLHKILSLKQKYKVVINEDIVNAVPVSSENDPRAIEFYTVKKGGLIPRTPYPTINNEWVNWE